jgi:hypothetical protein
MTVTANASHSEVSTVTRNECEECKRNPFWEHHCKTCHADDHNACSQCGGCMPAKNRLDRKYCSSTCRVRAHKWRKSPEAKAEEEAWRKSDDFEGFKDWKKGLHALAVAMDGGEQQHQRRMDRCQRFQRARSTAEICAGCGRDLEHAIVFLRSVGTGMDRGIGTEQSHRTAAVCADCICSRQGEHWLCEDCQAQGRRWRHDRHLGGYWVRSWYCRHAGPDHVGNYCGDCHPTGWQQGRCAGCERVVMYKSHGNRRFITPMWGNGKPVRAPGAKAEDYGGQSIVYCSTRCRSLVNRTEAAMRRAEDRGPRRCEECNEVIDGLRADARYCSQPCRQKAYRRRRAS